MKSRKIFICVVILIAVAILSGCKLIPSRAQKNDKNAESFKIWQEGISLQDRGETERAESRLAEAVALNEKDANIRRTYSDTLWRLGKKQEAIDQLSEALRLAGKPDTRILLSLADKCYDMGYYETALECAEKAIDCADIQWVATDENKLLLSRAWVIRARVHWRNNRFQPALNDYHKAISLCPKDQGVLSELATLQGAMGQHERALATWHSVSRLWPLDQEPQHVVFGRGEAYMGMRQYHLASDQFALAKERWPQDVNTYCRLVEAQLACGRIKEAATVAQRAAEIAPNNPATQAMHNQVQLALTQQQIR